MKNGHPIRKNGNKRKKRNGNGRTGYKRSKGEIAIAQTLKSMGIDSISEFKIDKFPYDFLISDTNTIIEYYGTRWHFDPRFYDADHYDKFTRQYAHQKWEKDNKKELLAKSKGYDIVIIWQYDWQIASNKRIFLEKLLKQAKEVKNGK